MTSLPLLRHYTTSSILGRRGQESITAAQYLSDVIHLAYLLPAHTYVINLCNDRYRFAVGLGAALIRQQISLLPPNETPGVLEQLSQDYPDLYCLSDRGVVASSIPVFAYPTAKENQPVAFDIPQIPASQQAIILFTSGSTGKPQPQPRSWGPLVGSSRAAGARLAIHNHPQATIVGTVPHQHSYGIESTIMLALQHGLILDAGRPLLPADILARLHEVSGPRLLVTTPIHLRALLADESLSLPQLDLVLSATAPLAPDLAAQAERRFGATLQEIYGCSEAGQIAMRRCAETQEWHCFDGIALRQEAESSWVSGSYIDRPTQLNDVLSSIDETHFLLQGRSADMINIAGKRSSLTYLNHLLNSIDGVRDGVFIMPETGMRLMAFVVAPGLKAETILAALRQHIDPAFLPRPLHLVAALPRNELGKLPREDALRLIAEPAE